MTDTKVLLKKMSEKTKKDLHHEFDDNVRYYQKIVNQYFSEYKNELEEKISSLKEKGQEVLNNYNEYLKECEEHYQNNVKYFSDLSGFTVEKMKNYRNSFANFLKEIGKQDIDIHYGTGIITNYQKNRYYNMKKKYYDMLNNHYGDKIIVENYKKEIEDLFHKDEYNGMEFELRSIKRNIEFYSEEMKKTKKRIQEIYEILSGKVNYDFCQGLTEKSKMVDFYKKGLQVDKKVIKEEKYFHLMNDWVKTTYEFSDGSTITEEEIDYGDEEDE